MSDEEVTRKVGRPSIENSSKKNVSAAMYLNEAEHAHFMTVVEGSGMSVSNFIRQGMAEHIVIPQQEGGANGAS